jgi:lipopolysaccharide/colanic/teichoic acid biosynthesis glycosyltransferase
MKKNTPNVATHLLTNPEQYLLKIGGILRKLSLDELPNLINIIKGEMSLVGPRPERKFYIDQILKDHPEYNYLFKVKPGLSSWGMVKFGYASSVEEMKERMPYDLMYIENISLSLDFKIMLLLLGMYPSQLQKYFQLYFQIYISQLILSGFTNF